MIPPYFHSKKNPKTHMPKISRKKTSTALLVVMMLILSSVNAFCQERFKEKYNLEFVAAPLVMFNPNFGNGGGAMGMALFDMDPDDDDLQASALSLTGLYSDRKSHVVGFGGSFFPNQDYRYKAGVGNGRIKGELDIDGFPETAKISTEFNAVFLEGQYCFADNFFAGARTIVKWIGYSPDNAAGSDYLELMNAVDTTSASIGPIISYDTRDNRFFPYKGLYSEVSCMINSKALGSDVNYHVLEGSLNGYKQHRKNHVVAGRFYGRFTPDDTPYSDLSTLGQKSDLRGFVAGEHVANNMIAIQLEYRWQFYNNWILVGFIGEAALYDNGDMSRDSFYTSGGGGVRYRLSDERRVNFRIDYAVGEGNSDGLYVGLTEAF